MEAMPRSLFLIVALACATACLKPNPRYCESDEDCPQWGYDYCDLHGIWPESEGIGHTCIDNPIPDAGPDIQCTAGEFIQCTDSRTALHCDASGTSYATVACPSECDPTGGCRCEPDTSSCSDDVELLCASDGSASVSRCALGCNASGERCVDIEPSNGLGGFLDMTPGAPDVVLTSGAVIDTDQGRITDGDGAVIEVPAFQITSPAGGVPVRVFAVKSLRLDDTAIIGSRAAAFVSHRDILIEGIVRIEAGQVSDGACVGGDSRSQTMSCGGFICPSVASGAGGGGFGTLGAAGGSARAGSLTASPGGAGISVGTDALVPLRGGCRGGRPNTNEAPARAGGALQLSSRTIIKLVEGTEAFLDAGGMGGVGGGGSGGGVLLEAPRVVISNRTGVVANGGAGGCAGHAGEDGNRSKSVALGNDCADITSSAIEAGPGGNGAAGGNLATPGGSINSSVADKFHIAGSGGGGAGRIRVNVPSPVDFQTFGTVSPTPSVGVLATR
jgi:hypothetical protein